MGASTTKYLVDIDYRLKGLEKANRALGDAGNKAGRAERSLFSLKNLMIGGLAMRGFGFLKTSLVDANASLDTMTTGMATVIGYNLSLPFSQAQPAARALVDEFRSFAKVSLGETKDYLEMSNMIVGAVTSQGGALKDLKEITKGAVVAASVFGARPDVAGLDISQALNGTVTARDRLAKQLIEPIMTVEKFNKASAARRMEVIKQALTSPQIMDAAKQLGESYEGRVSTLKDTIAQTFQKAGRPLYVWLTGQLQLVNAWAEKNQAAISKFAADFGNALVRGFEAIKTFGTWIYDNRGTLLKVAEAFLVFKGLSALSGGVNSIIGGMSSLTTASGTAAMNLMHLAGAAGLAVMSMHWKSDVVKGAVGYVENWKNKNDPETIKKNRDNAMYSAYEKQRDAKKALEEKTAAARVDLTKKVPGKPPNKVHVTIKKIEVVADDSENFVHQMWGAVEKEFRVPSQSSSMPRGAG